MKTSWNKFYFLLFLLLFTGTITNLKSQNISPERKVFLLDSISNNPSGKIYFFDDTEISELCFFEKGLSGELKDNLSGIMCLGKEAILRFGERYRYGIVIWKSKEKTNEDKNEKE